MWAHIAALPQAGAASIDQGRTCSKGRWTFKSYSKTGAK